MDCVASGRLHPLDQAFNQAFNQACTVASLFLLGHDGGAFAGVAVGFTLLALFQHATCGCASPGGGG